MRAHTLALMTFVLAACSSSASTSPTMEACATGACPVPLQTQPPPAAVEACEEVRISGILAADPTYGLGLSYNGAVHGVIWPNGFSARRESDGIALIDPNGEVVAREGNRVQMAGVIGGGAVVYPCDPPNLHLRVLS
jgi:hypothetical protein